MDRVKICLMGAGRVGRVHGSNLSHSIREANLVAVVDKNQEAAEKLSQELNVSKYFDSHERALDWGEFDAVVITTPTFTHASIAVDAATSGKHVFCEKPVATSLREADEMIRATEKAHVKLQIGFMRRFDRDFLEAKKRIEEGIIGKALLIKSTGRGPGLPPEWAWSTQKGAGMLAEVASHDFDALRWFAESEFKRIYVIAKNYKSPEIRKKYPDFYDTAIVMVEFWDGKMGMVDMGCPVEYGYDARMEVLGERGVVFIGDVKGQQARFCTEKSGVIASTFPSWRDRFKEAYVEEMRHFVDIILKDISPLVTGEDGKKALEAVIAANKSIQIGQPVNFSL
ncbi:MAG: Gfo/Idh/MocA family oxidoreductase [bacterium]